jgi:hypothetical protein
MADRVDHFNCEINTTDLAHSYIRLSYVIKDPQTGERRPVEHSVGLATSAGKWWFVDGGRCCDELCLVPGGDRLRHPEDCGIKREAETPAKSVQSQPRAVPAAKRDRQKADWRQAKTQVKEATQRWLALCKVGLRRMAMAPITRNLVELFASMKSTLRTLWKRGKAPKMITSA